MLLFFICVFVFAVGCRFGMKGADRLFRHRMVPGLQPQVQKRYLIPKQNVGLHRGTLATALVVVVFVPAAACITMRKACHNDFHIHVFDRLWLFPKQNVGGRRRNHGIVPF